MAYSAENINDIKRAGRLEDYIAMERELIERLEDAKIEHDVQGRDSVSYGHLYGRIWIDSDVKNSFDVVATVSAGSDWSKRWSGESFGDNQQRARAYAVAALSSQLKGDAARILGAARGRLATLLASQ